MVKLYASDTGWVVTDGVHKWEFESLTKAQVAARVVAKHGSHDQSSHGRKGTTFDVPPKDDETFLSDVTVHHEVLNPQHKDNTIWIYATHKTLGRVGKLGLTNHMQGIGRLVGTVEVPKEFQRKGVASAMWDYAKKNGFEPQHSPRQTPEGKAWAAVTKHGNHDQSTHGHRGFSADFVADDSISGYVTYRSKSTNMTVEMEKSITPKRRQEILDALGEMQDVAPIDDVTVKVSKGAVNGRYGVTVMSAGPKQISLNAAMMYGPKPEDALFSKYKGVSAAKYTVVHEWGHAVAAAKTTDFSRVPKHDKIFEAAQDAAGNLGMSKYGMSNSDEFFAEAFADWHLSGGAGTTEATRQMAELGNWSALSETVLKADSVLMIVDTFSVTVAPTREILTSAPDADTEMLKHGSHDQSSHGHRDAGATTILSEYGDEVKMMQGTISNERRTSYGDAHEAPSSGNDFDVNILNIEEHMPDVLGSRGMQLYRTGSPKADKESMDALRSMTGDPNQKMTIYRAVPENITEFNDGNWVSLSPTYAAQHVMSRFDGKAHVISAEVPVSSLWTNGDSINEIGFDRGADVSKGSVRWNLVGYVKGKLADFANVDEPVESSVTIELKRFI